MKKFVAIVFAFAAGLAQAQEAGLTAGQVHLNCLIADAKQDRNSFCAAVIQGFGAGFVVGARHGASTVFLYDRPALLTLAGIDDYSARLKALSEPLYCVPDWATTLDLIGAFNRYATSHPERNNHLFANVMLDAMKSAYRCK